MILMMMTLGMNCAGIEHKADFSVVLEKKPELMPALVDGSPERCPECDSLNGQKMWKMTHRDFKIIKKKLAEQDDFILYLIDIVEGLENI